MNQRSPVEYDASDGQWYFYNEVWADRYGPYPTEESAHVWCDAYAKSLDGDFRLWAELTRLRDLAQPDQLTNTTDEPAITQAELDAIWAEVKRKETPSGKPIIRVRAHRWNRSPYRSGETGTIALEVLYVKQRDDWATSVLYNSDGEQISYYGSPMAKSRVEATAAEYAPLLARLQAAFPDYEIAVVRADLWRNRLKWSVLSLDQLPERI